MSIDDEVINLNISSYSSDATLLATENEMVLLYSFSGHCFVWRFEKGDIPKIMDHINNQIESEKYPYTHITWKKASELTSLLRVYYASTVKK